MAEQQTREMTDAERLEHTRQELSMALGHVHPFAQSWPTLLDEVRDLRRVVRAQDAAQQLGHPLSDWAAPVDPTGNDRGRHNVALAVSARELARYGEHSPRELLTAAGVPDHVVLVRIVNDWRTDTVVLVLAHPGYPFVEYGAEAPVYVMGDPRVIPGRQADVGEAERRGQG